MDYKERKIQFVSDGLGSSVTRINLICSTALTTYSIYTHLSHSTLRKPTTKTAILEFLILIIPLLFSLTVFSSHPIYLNTILLTISYGLSFTTSPVPSKVQLSNKNEVKLFNKPFITVYRAHMMIMTILSILAVDFQVFPREFGKAENFGTSLMDLGVGSFVFSLGLVGALPVLRGQKKVGFLKSIWAEIKRSAGVLALGLVRVVMVKGVDYPEHITEYGVHWNFFFTLGLLPILFLFLSPLSPKFDFTAIALFVSISHQFNLSFTNLSDWVANAPRLGLISANKEGLVSLPGYLAIFLLGVATGTYTLPPSPSFFKHLNLNSSNLPAPPSFMKTKIILSESMGRVGSEDSSKKGMDKLSKSYRDCPGKVASVLGSWAILWWTGHFLLVYFGLPVSRQLANLNYVVWTVAFNTSFLLCYLLIHTYSVGRMRVGIEVAPSSPIIFDAINRNGLVVFLAANLLTGLVNITFDSMNVTAAPAMLILSVYSMVVVGIAWSLRSLRMRL